MSNNLLEHVSCRGCISSDSSLSQQVGAAKCTRATPPHQARDRTIGSSRKKKVTDPHIVVHCSESAGLCTRRSAAHKTRAPLLRALRCSLHAAPPAARPFILRSTTPRGSLAAALRRAASARVRDCGGGGGEGRRAAPPRAAGGAAAAGAADTLPRRRAEEQSAPSHIDIV